MQLVMQYVYRASGLIQVHLHAVLVNSNSIPMNNMIV